MTISAAPTTDELETHRRELTGYCYRMLGTANDAEDAVQETMLRAWRAADGFEGRASVRSWLYRIATNVCLDMHRSAGRRVRPMELGPASLPDESLLGPMAWETPWISPIPDDRVIAEGADPAEIAVARDSIRLAFITALQHLPAKGRAVLILCEVLRWPAAEVAELLATSVPAVNSALQRARATLADLPPESRPRSLDADQSSLLARYVQAFEAYDIDRLVNLLHQDAIQSMPPFAIWLRGATNIGTWMVQPGPSGCCGSKLVPTTANGCPAFGQYRRDPAGGYHPWALQVLEVTNGRIAELAFFLDTAHVFPLFGLPAHLPG